MAGLNYSARLDGLRFFAISFVLFEHFAYGIGRLFSAGFYGVNLFFVLSGFLITSILLKNSLKPTVITYRLFLGRRLLRIFPVYYAAILILFLIGAPKVGEEFVYLITYTYNFRLAVFGDWDAIFVHFWSLCVEEQFYLFFPLITLFVSTRGRERNLSIIYSLLCLVSVIQILFDVFTDTKFNYTGLLTNMWPLCLGAIGAIHGEFIVRQKFMRSQWFELLLFVVLFVCLVRLPWRAMQVVLPVLSLLFVLKAYYSGFKSRHVNIFLQHPVIVSLGKVSYGVYVYHLILGYYLTKYAFDPVWSRIPFRSLGSFAKLEYNSWIVKLPLYSFVSFSVALLSFRFFETPLLSLKDRYLTYK